MSDTVTIEVRIQVKADHLWSSVFGAGAEYTFPWWTGLTFEDGATWETPGPTGGYVTLTSYNPDTGEDRRKHWLGLDDIAAAYQDYLTLGYTCWLDDFDSIQADLVLQIACFGEVVYG